jgi:CheY-like chemotaxis protein
VKPYRILVAEDNASLLESIRVRLTAEGYEVLCAQDGYQAVALARAHAPDLLLLDINMPAGDGFTVQDRVRRMVNLGRIPIVYITGHRSPLLLDKARNLGAGSLLCKPFEARDLLRAIRDALEPDESRAESFAAA